MQFGDSVDGNANLFLLIIKIDQSQMSDGIITFKGKVPLRVK